MNIVEYGTQNPETVLLLHGGGLSWWNYRKAAELLGETHHVILPVLDGHAGSSRDFSSIRENAEEILRLVDARCGGSVLLMGGVSLGAQVLLEVLALRPDVCRYAVVESASVIPSGLTAALLAPSVSCSYGLIKQKWFARLQFRYLRIDPDLFEEYYRDTCAITRENMIAFLKASVSYAGSDALRNCTAQCAIFAGGREQRGMRRSAERLHTLLPNSTLEVKQGLYHGEFSMNHPREYARTLQALIK
jgi:pimeloyl-ACP methyl ester carboxylesterase